MTTLQFIFWCLKTAIYSALIFTALLIIFPQNVLALALAIFGATL